MRHRHLTSVDVPLEGPVATPIRLLGSTASMAAAIEFIAGGRYRCRLAPGELADVVVSEPFDVPRVSGVREQYPGAALVIWDRREATGAAAIARALDAGVDAYVSSGYVGVLVAHLDALLRRPPSTPRYSNSGSTFENRVS